QAVGIERWALQGLVWRQRGEYDPVRRQVAPDQQGIEAAGVVAPVKVEVGLHRCRRRGQVDPLHPQGVEILADVATAGECRHGHHMAGFNQMLGDLVRDEFRSGVLRQRVVRQEDSGHGRTTVSTGPLMQATCRRWQGGNEKGPPPLRGGGPGVVLPVKAYCSRLSTFCGTDLAWASIAVPACVRIWLRVSAAVSFA